MGISLGGIRGKPRRRKQRVRIDRRVAVDVVPTLHGPYDLAFFDSHTPIPKLHAVLHRLLRRLGVLVTANLNRGGIADAVGSALLDREIWLTAFVDEEGETAIGIKV
jgi:predicted O-methyltransferase YrrM